jgi:hypothetical protein
MTCLSIFGTASRIGHALQSVPTDGPPSVQRDLRVRCVCHAAAARSVLGAMFKQQGIAVSRRRTAQRAGGVTQITKRESLRKQTCLRSRSMLKVLLHFSVTGRDTSQTLRILRPGGHGHGWYGLHCCKIQNALAPNIASHSASHSNTLHIRGKRICCRCARDKSEELLGGACVRAAPASYR